MQIAAGYRGRRQALLPKPGVICDGKYARKKTACDEDVIEYRSEIAQPPICVFGFKASEPETEGVEQTQDHEPDDVDGAEPESEIGWEEVRRATKGRYGVKDE